MEDLENKSKLIHALQDRLSSKEQAMMKQSEVIAQMSLTHAKQAETIQEMARMCQSKGSSSSLSRHRKSRSDSPVSNYLGQSRNPVSLFGSSSYRPSESSIGIGHPLSNYG